MNTTIVEQTPHENEIFERNGNGSSAVKLTDRHEPGYHETLHESKQQSRHDRSHRVIGGKRWVIGGVPAGVVLIGVLLYGLHAGNFQVVSPAAIWIGKVPKSTSAQVPAH